MKRKIISVLLTIGTAIAFGYLFVLSWLVGLLASHYIAGNSPGEKGRFSSFIIPFRSWRIHLHHWLYSLLLLGLSLAFRLHFYSPAVTYGVLAGVMFQGIYYYDDWHVVLLDRRKGRSEDKGE